MDLEAHGEEEDERKLDSEDVSSSVPLTTKEGEEDFLDLSVTGDDSQDILSADGTSSVGGDGASVKSHVSVRLKKLGSNVAHNRASAYAAEYTKLVEAKTVAFHRRLERGKGLMLRYARRGSPWGGKPGFPMRTGYETIMTSLTVDVVLSASNGLCWWRANMLGPLEAMRLKGVCQCFGLANLMDVGVVEGDVEERSFFLRLTKAEQTVDFMGSRFSSRAGEAVNPLDGFDLVFTAATTNLCLEMVRGFELLRKHHSQLFFTREQTNMIRTLTSKSRSGTDWKGVTTDLRSPSTVVDDASEIAEGEELSPTTTRSSRVSRGASSKASRAETYRSLAQATSSENLTRQLSIQMTRQQSVGTTNVLRLARSSRAEYHESAEFSKFNAAAALGEVDDETGQPTFKTKQAAINPTAFHHVAAYYDPRRNPAHQHFEQQIFAKVVEVYYEAFQDHGAKIRLPNGRYFGVPTEHFCDGVWVTATVSDEGFNPETNEYTLLYKDGPFEIDDGIECKIAKFPQGTVFESVHRDDIHIDIQDQPIAGFPYFIMFITTIQVGIYVAWVNFGHSGRLGGPTWLSLSLVSNWPECRDNRRQIWRYAGYQFVHSSAGHITFNAIVQLLIGTPLELVHGFYRVGLIYELSVVMGALYVVFLLPEDVVVGASGGVYSLFGVHLGHTILNFNELRRGLFNRWVRLALLATFIGVDISITANETGSGRDNRARTSYAAHLGGFFSGLMLSMWFLHEYAHYPREHLARKASALLVVLIAITFVVWNIMHDPPRGILTSGRSDLYCCYQALYCSGVKKNTYNIFSCTYDDEDTDSKFIVWRGSAAEAPDTTYSCDQLKSAYWYTG
ncbi:hypothetical protein CTAYLR_006486 [Chrysophaeum taylorii]|uniref:Peptidase S54 rhomboid domain-containing protein n=1 Tax=Chrysophaeum taylorii TaxID=2483200 RepID=A0AAD7UL91_9STRA|nr:hypothetical protein CTAYLR_006486 [Chrysophaeum taylorii]